MPRGANRRPGALLPPADLGPRAALVATLTLMFGFAQLVLQAGGSPLAAGTLPSALTCCALLVSRLAGRD